MGITLWPQRYGVVDLILVGLMAVLWRKTFKPESQIARRTWLDFFYDKIPY